MRKKPYVITVFGAESTGKTTLSKQLAETLGGAWTEEFARPYLEQSGEGVTNASMRAIWEGQRALQQAAHKAHHTYVVRDTDLFSTVGYWQLPHVEPKIGPCPPSLIRDAKRLRSDLYVITPSNIPFEPDVLRYGGDKRESPDDYWIDLCKHYRLPYIVIGSADRQKRLNETLTYVTERSIPCVAS